MTRLGAAFRTLDLATMRSSTTALMVVLLVGCRQDPTPSQIADVLIVDALLVDGTGAPPRRGDVLVRDGFVVQVGRVDATEIDAERTIRAEGRVLAPGFIDLHSHGDPRRQSFENFLAMGVTTVVLGQDGAGPGGDDVAAWLASAEAAGVQVNVATLTGHGTLRRRAAIADDLAVPSAAALARLMDLLRADLDAGAFGMSTGLEYVPGRRARRDELVALAAVVGAADGVVMSHMRSEDDDAIDAALDELLAQGAGCRVHASHLKVVYGQGVARAARLLSRFEEASRAGIHISADVYPYAASYTGIGIVFPDWALPPADWSAVVRDRRGELAAYLGQRVARRNGPEAILFGEQPHAGKTLATVAREAGKSFVDVLIDDLGPRGPGAAHFVMDVALQDALVVSPLTAVATDGGPHMRHPRGFGSFAKLIEHYVRDLASLTLVEAVRKASGYPASILGLPDRGVVRVGARADLILFDPAAVRANADFEDPFRFASGFDLVLVNGIVAREAGSLAPVRAGSVLRRLRSRR